jgi:hypothetical protein
MKRTLLIVFIFVLLLAIASEACRILAFKAEYNYSYDVKTRTLKNQKQFSITSSGYPPLAIKSICYLAYPAISIESALCTHVVPESDTKGEFRKRRIMKIMDLERFPTAETVDIFSDESLVFYDRGPNYLGSLDNSEIDALTGGVASD